MTNGTSTLTNLSRPSKFLKIYLKDKRRRESSLKSKETLVSRCGTSTWSTTQELPLVCLRQEDPSRNFGREWKIRFFRILECSMKQERFATFSRPMRCPKTVTMSFTKWWRKSSSKDISTNTTSWTTKTSRNNMTIQVNSFRWWYKHMGLPTNLAESFWHPISRTTCMKRWWIRKLSTNHWVL